MRTWPMMQCRCALVPVFVESRVYRQQSPVPPGVWATVLEKRAIQARLLEKLTTGESMRTSRRESEAMKKARRQRRSQTLVEEIHDYLETCRENNTQPGSLPPHKYCTLLNHALQMLTLLNPTGAPVGADAPQPEIPKLSKTDGRALFMLQANREILNPLGGDAKALAQLQSVGCVDPWFKVTDLGHDALRCFIESSKK